MGNLLQKSRYKAARRWLIFWCLFIGIGAVGGATCMLIDPSGRLMGMDALLPFFQVLPFADVLFQNFVFPGFALLIVNGLTNLISAVLLLRHKKAGVITGMLWGITLMLWICIQFVIFPMNTMSTAYFLFGLLQFVTGYACYVFMRQESFVLDKGDYTHIGEKGDTLVLYFSRMGYTAKMAYETANKLGADIEEVTTPERTQGTLGFWWCGRFGMHGWSMPVNELHADVQKYERVVLCSPIWVFSPCAPMKGLCEALSGKVKHVQYVFVHFNPWLPASAAASLDKRLGIVNEGVTDVCCRLGKVKKRNEVHAQVGAEQGMA